MKDIAIIGKGGLGREIKFLIEQINEESKIWNFIGFFDDNEIVDDNFYLGKVSSVNSYDRQLSIVIGIGDPNVRNNIANSISNELILFPNIFHPSLLCDEKSFTCGIGNVVCANNIISTDVAINDFVIINLSSTVGHDVSIESYTTINPGVNISGNVKIEESVMLGTGSCIIQGLTIRKNSVVGAGSVVLRDVESGHTVIGNPARPIRRNL